MIEFADKLEQLEQKYKISLPEGFRAELLGLHARHHLEMMSLHTEMFSKPAMWRDCEDSLKRTESIALSMLATQKELRDAEKKAPKMPRWWEALKSPLGRKIV